MREEQSLADVAVGVAFSGATKSEIDGGSHAIALSQPERVVAVILEALSSVD